MLDRDVTNLDTAPLPAVELPLSPRAAGRAADDVSTVLLVRAIVAGTATIALLMVAGLLFAHGVRDDTFPPYLSGTKSTTIVRYSAPWIAGAAGCALLAGLAFVSFGVDLFRHLRLQRARRAGRNLA
ncbi:hypothetical protein SAMN04515671_2459 [Nakamurella panacisegetis]|uniref:Uncharacterized protein n=1 Tax=Nakamurella panacisegetis TaxID=1090615 RepID=A0A1H0NR64_9ACTN|nr:hypothetical protein [Nakamurella panacisegetis]SDO95277.1 hypothetical protein SAMN04515671_2459 [Nakamurella panacisegetis]